MSIFTSHQAYLNGNSIHDIQVDSESSVEAILPKISNEVTVKPLLYQLIALKDSDQKQTLVNTDLLDRLLPLINADKETSSCAYIIIQHITSNMDHDELVEVMMDQLYCISWEFGTAAECLNIARLSSLYVALFGQGLEKMKRAREWMLFVPFLAKYFLTTMDTIEFILVEHSMYGQARKEKRDEWEDVVDLYVGSCLDFVEYVYTCTVAQPVSEFPIETTDIGLENGDVKRRYLGYFLTHLIYDRILLNLNMQLSKLYFEKFHPMYNVKRPNQPTLQDTNKPMLAIVQRCLQLSVSSGFTVDRMVTLLQSLNKKDHDAISLEDRVSDDDRQMINSRLFPLGDYGMGSLISFSVYDKISSESLGLCPDSSALEFAEKYIGTVLHLLSGSNANQVEKGVFVLLYLADETKTTVTMQDMEKPIEGPNGLFQASQIMEMISSVASTHADASIRFFSYKLIESFLNFGDDETRVFFLTELLHRCPFPCMKTAAIGLLKDQIDGSFEKGVSVFTSPLIITKFFPLVFKSNWNKESFLDDYNHVMQALNIYYYLLIKDRQHNLTTVWNQENIDRMQRDYLNPLVALLDVLKPNKENDLQDMQVDMMKNVVYRILAKVSNNVQLGI